MQIRKLTFTDYVALIAYLTFFVALYEIQIWRTTRSETINLLNVLWGATISGGAIALLQLRRAITKKPVPLNNLGIGMAFASLGVCLFFGSSLLHLYLLIQIPGIHYLCTALWVLACFFWASWAIRGR